MEGCKIMLKRLLLITLASMLAETNISAVWMLRFCLPTTSCLKASRYKAGVCQIYIAHRLT